MEKEHGKCKRCGKVFHANRYWQLFCGTACKKAYEAEERKAALEAYRTKIAEPTK